MKITSVKWDDRIFQYFREIRCGRVKGLVCQDEEYGRAQVKTAVAPLEEIPRNRHQSR